MKIIDNLKEILKKIIPTFIFLSLLSILFFPQDKINYLYIPILSAILLGILYWFIRK